MLTLTTINDLLLDMLTAIVRKGYKSRQIQSSVSAQGKYKECRKSTKKRKTIVNLLISY